MYVRIKKKKNTYIGGNPFPLGNCVHNLVYIASLGMHICVHIYIYAPIYIYKLVCEYIHINIYVFCRSPESFVVCYF